MKTPNVNLTRTLVALAAVVTAFPAPAALLDRGPADPALGFPQWYRDTNGTAIGICRSQAQSPNPNAGLAPMCFPIEADPAGFPGNLGSELFYNNLTVVTKNGGPTGGFSLRYVAALEATYLPLGVPVRGGETVFARIRVVMSTETPGTYTVTHPFGVDVFPDVGTGPRAVFFTVDIPVGPALDFDSALTGRVGPFIEWDIVNAGETLTVGAEQFVGDPNYPHTYKGSPFGTNYVRVDGPPGSNLDGAGNDFIVEPLGAVLGQRWTAPIPTKFAVQKAVYSRNAASNSVDVWATSAPGQQLIVTGAGLPTLQLAEFPAGSYYGHVVYDAAFIPPASITVTNLTSNPVNSVTVGLPDQLDAFTSFDPATGVLSVSATSSDLSGGVLSVLGNPGGLMTPTATPGTYTFSGLLPAGVEPPMQIRVESNAGGFYLSNVVVTATAPMNAAGAPVAVADAAAVAGAGPTALDVSLNDTFSGAFRVRVISQPVTGTAVAAPSGGLVTYTPSPGAVGPDQFTYVIQDAVGFSNVAVVSFDVPFVAPAPSANADNNAMLQGTSKILNVLANDVAGTGTVIDPASVQINTPAGRGVAVANANGTITYTPNAGVNSVLDTFSYTVANTAGTRSAPAIVTIDIFGGAESVSFSRIQYTSSKAAWTITGATNWFNAALTQATATCWTGTAAAPTPTTLIGTAPIDTAGKFALVPAGPTPTPANPSSITCQSSYGGIKSGGVVFK